MSKSISQTRQHIAGLFLKSKLAHANLFVGPSGIGKYLFAIDFAKSILCLNNSENKVLSCKSCASCLMDIEYHPDLINLKIDKKSSVIKVDDIRTLNEFCYTVPTISKCKVVIINDAHFLNIQAANALLKTLEEPPLKCYFFLITDKPSLLPATILSRVVRHNLIAPSIEESLAIMENHSISKDDALNLLGIMDTPYNAIKYSNDDSLRILLLNVLLDITKTNDIPLNVVGLFKNYKIIDIVNNFQMIIYDMAKYKLINKSSHGDYGSFIKSFSDATKIGSIFNIYKLLLNTSYELSKVVSLNQELIIEQILYSFKDSCVS